MDSLFLIARIAFGALYISSGVKHLSASADMAGYVRSKGVPAAKAAVLGSGVLLVAGGAAFLFVLVVSAGDDLGFMLTGPLFG